MGAIKVSVLQYPFTYQEWLAHPSTKPKLKWIRETCVSWREEGKVGKQLEIQFN